MTGYNIFLSNGALLTTVNVKTIDVMQHSSLFLIGQGIPNYGTMVAQDFIYLTENFSKSSPPVNPLVGQLWHDSQNDVLKMYTNGKTWSALGGGLDLFADQVEYEGSGMIAATDAFKTIVLSGPGFYQITLGNPAIYPNNAIFLIVNTSTRGKSITPTGHGGFILWPGQILFVQNIDNVWRYNTSRWAPRGNVVFYVDNVNGSDTSDGLDNSGYGPGCFKTVQHAYNTILGVIDAQSQITITIQLPRDTAGTPINEQCNIYGMVGAVAYDVEIVGNPTTPTLCEWFLTTGGDQPLLSIADWATVTLDGISLGVSSGNVPALIQCRQLCICDMKNLFLANNPTQVALKLLDNARMNFIGPITIDGNYESFIQILFEGSLDGQSCNFIVGGFCDVGIFVQIIGSGTVALQNATFTGAITSISGQIYSLNGPCALVTAGSVAWPPSFTAGSSSNGGVNI